MRNIYIIFLSAILIFYFITRIFRIDLIPSSVYWDEASIGYNAYSILKTGKDEWGEFLPIHFKAFGEYKLPFYIYTVSFFELIFGLSIIAVRIPAVLFGLGVVYLTYLLGLLLYKNKEVAILGAFLITTSGWFFIFSRTGYEAVAGLFWFMLMIYSWLKSRVQKTYLPLAGLSFILSIYSYNSYRVISFILLSIIIYDIARSGSFIKKKLLVTIFIFIVVASLIPISNIYLLNKGNNRFGAIGIFDKNKKNIEIIAIFLKNYSMHFSPSFLLRGDINLRSQQEGFGQLYIIDLLFLIISLIYVVKYRQLRQVFPIAIVLISFIPSALTKEAPHALRSLSAVPFISLIAAHGILIVSKLKNKTLNIFLKKPYFYILIVIIYLSFFGNYFYSFVKNYELISFDSWQYGYKKIYDNYKTNFKDFDNIIISDKYSQPYIFTLFYLGFDPQKFREHVIYNQNFKYVTSLVYKLDKFTYNNIDFYNFPKGKDLIFAHPSERLSEIPYNEVILNPDGSIAFYVYKYTNE